MGGWLDGRMAVRKPHQRECVGKIMANIMHSGSGYKTGVNVNPELHITQTSCIHLYHTFKSIFWFPPLEFILAK